jgi:hypothetical protein
LLQVKLEHQQKSTIKVKAVGSGDSTVKEFCGYWKALDKAADTGGGTKRNFLQQKNHQPTKRHLQSGAPVEEAFLSMKTANQRTQYQTEAMAEAEKML